MHLQATASTTVRNKNLIMIVAVAVFALWFAYDGWKGWPARDDGLVASAKAWSRDTTHNFSSGDLPALEAWQGWHASTNDQRQAMTSLMVDQKHVEGWKSPTDIFWQRVLTAGLAVATAVSLGWFAHCQRRRAIATDEGLSTTPGVVIPWDKITKIDNRRWKKKRHRRCGLPRRRRPDPQHQTRRLRTGPRPVAADPQ